MNLHWLSASVHCQSAQLGTITASIVANKAMANLRQRLNALIRTTRTGSPITCRQRECPTRSPNSNSNSVLSPEQVLQPVSLSSGCNLNLPCLGMRHTEADRLSCTERSETHVATPTPTPSAAPHLKSSWCRAYLGSSRARQLYSPI